MPKEKVRNLPDCRKELTEQGEVVCNYLQNCTNSAQEEFPDDIRLVFELTRKEVIKAALCASVILTAANNFTYRRLK